MASASQMANRRTANSGQPIWYTGLSCLSCSSNETNETDRRNQMNQLPATCCTGYLFLFVRLTDASVVARSQLSRSPSPLRPIRL
jgi:hypothetical protein